MSMNVRSNGAVGRCKLSGGSSMLQKIYFTHSKVFDILNKSKRISGADLLILPIYRF